jgi:hypothetical protein
MSSNFVSYQDIIGPRLGNLSTRAATIQFNPQHISYLQQLIGELEKEFDKAENQTA